MLYDRPYMRQAAPLPARGMSAVTALVVATVGVFLAQHLLTLLFPGPAGMENDWMHRFFSLSGEHVREGKVWTLLSYGFLHDTRAIFHILGNLLGLFFVGRILEPLLGRRAFLGLYFGGMLTGALLYLVLHFGGSMPVVGASAAVFAIVTFFCLLRPEQEICLLLFFVLPVTLKPKWLFWAMLVFSGGGTLLYELPGNSFVAHSAHLGGMLGGILFFRYVYSEGGHMGGAGNVVRMEPPKWMQKRRKARRNFDYRVNRGSRDEVQKEVDRILDKINQSGFGSLSEEERKTLDEARDFLSRKS
jgi:membrane associated rhomboid family serine protease